MKCEKPSPTRTRGSQQASLLAIVLACLSACTRSDADKDGSQTHFGNRNDGGQQQIATGQQLPDADVVGSSVQSPIGTTLPQPNPDDDDTANPTNTGTAPDTDDVSKPNGSESDVTEPVSDEPDTSSTATQVSGVDAGPSTPSTELVPDAAVEPCALGTSGCGVARPLCSATTFEDTNDGCLEESWLWDGQGCVQVSHCGCAGGDCARLHPEQASCLMAHEACVADDCLDQDARSGALMCGSVEGFSFRGWQCETVFCTCSGNECDQISATAEECQSRFAHCLQRSAPACVDSIFPVTTTDPGVEPTSPAYDFSVEGYEELIDSQSDAAVIFEDFTPAQWLGWQEVPQTEFCAPLTPGRFTFTCPVARSLLLQVGEDVVQVNVTLHWDAAVQETLAPTDVEVRISKHPSGSLVLEVRDPADQQPVLVVVGSRPEHAGAKAAWTFGPFTFSAGSPRCMTSADACNWTFSALNLNVEAGEQKLELHAQGSGSMTSDGSTFAIMHGYIFEQSTVGTESCGAAKSWHQNFALMRISPIVEE